MPSFYPSTVPYHSTSNNFGHGDGYKNACYQDLSDTSGYADFNVASSQKSLPTLPDPYNRSAKLPSVVAPGTMYGQPFVPSQRQDFQPGPQRGYSLETTLLYEASQQQLAAYKEAQVHANSAANMQPAYVPKEEKPVGGVSATLDYDIEKMTDFVTETAFGIYELCASPRLYIADIDLLRSVRPNTNLPSSFRKWVLSMLHATRLPSATILLSLAYLAQRVRDQTTSNTFDPSEVGLYRSLTVALILGSKFLDDNTFQNKSWAEVSLIPVADLNKAEHEWLMAIGHRLHQAPERFDGYLSCEQLWLSFKARAPKVPSTSLGLQPIDTSIRSYGSHRSPKHLPHSNYRQPYSKPASLIDPALLEPQYRAYYEPWHSQSASPASAQTSGPQTPNYYNGNMGWGPPADMYGRSDCGYYGEPYPSFPTSRDQYASQPFYGYGQGAYMQGQNYWNCHGSACQCGNCRQANLIPRYGPTVAG